MDNTVPIPGDDPEMNTAMEEARRRLPEFRRALDEDARRVVPEIEGALVKAAISSIATGKTEHIWVEDAGFEDDMVVGTVSSEPNQIPEVAKGDWITISPHDISDWVYRHRGRTFGCFTVKVRNGSTKDRVGGLVPPPPPPPSIPQARELRPFLAMR